MPLGVDNRFTLDFLSTELIYQINFSTKNDYYITPIKCNLVIAKDYGVLLDDKKKLLTKSWLYLEKGAAYQFDLSLVELVLSFPGMEKRPDKKDLLDGKAKPVNFSPNEKKYQH